MLAEQTSKQLKTIETKKRSQGYLNSEARHLLRAHYTYTYELQ